MAIRTGSWGLPEFGLTERLANFFGQGRTAQGGSNLFGNQAQTTLVPTSRSKPAFVPSGTSGAYGITQRQGNVLGVTAPPATSPTVQPPAQNTGNAGVSTNGQVNNQDFSQLIETPPPQPSFENLYGSVFDTALSNIESQIGTTEQETAKQMELAKQVQQGRDLGVNQRLTSQQGQFDINKQELQTEESQTANQLRQQVAEMNQGIQSRYGGTTGTGRFASEILGRSFVQEMSANRQNLTNKISIIEQNRNDAISQANKQIFESQLQTQQDIAQLTAQKNNAITELRNQQGLLGIQRSKMIVDAVNNYNQQIEGVRQQNSRFYQNLYLKQVDFDNKVKESQLTAYKDYAKQQTDFNNRITRIFLGGGISDEAIPSVEQQLGLSRGQLQQPKKKDQFSNESLAGLSF